MNDAGLYGKGLSFPPRIDGKGSMVWSEGANNVRECIRVILLTETGERIRRNTFGAGLSRYLFEPNTVATRFSLQSRIETALQKWEPRIRVQAVAVDPDPDDPTAAIATITYLLVATESVERVSLSLNLGMPG